MELKVIWTDPAIEDLRKIRDYIAKDNPIAAVSFGMEYSAVRAILAVFQNPAVCINRLKTVQCASCLTVATASFIRNMKVR